MGEEFRVTFVCKDVIFSSSDGKYSVLSVRDVSFEDPVFFKDIKNLVIKGDFSNINPGRGICITGLCEWTNNDKYGWQLYCHSSFIALPSSDKGIVSFLASFCPGVGKSMAKKIVEVYKEETLLKIKESENYLTCIKGIGNIKAKKIRRSVIEHSYIEELSRFMYSFGVTDYNSINAIYNTYKSDSISTLESDPYVLCDLIPNGFLVADKMVQMLNLQVEPMERLSNVLYYYIKSQTSFGDMCMEYTSIEAFFPAFLKRIGINDILLGRNSLYEALELLCDRFKIRYFIADGKRYVYEDKNFKLEDDLSYEISKLLANKRTGTSLSNAFFEDFFAAFEGESSLSLAGEQKKAVITSISSNLSLITGGAGVGKTVTISALISLMDKLGKSFALAAPTGRAAKRITEVTGKDAYTLHRLLFVSKSDDDCEYEYCPDNNLEYDYILCDEASMIDESLFKILITCCNDNKISLIMIGDDNQLPPVGKGFVFKDLVAMDNLVPVSKLTTLFRQGEDSQIYGNARKILEGDCNLSFTLTNQDFFFFKTGSYIQSKDIILKSINSLIGLGVSIDDIAVLSPMSKGCLGCMELNKFLQEALNDSDKALSFSNKLYTFYVGDKVMQIVNNYDLLCTDVKTGKQVQGVFNGDIGRVESIDEDNETFTVIYDNGSLGTFRVTYDFGMSDDISLAYCMTVHKSQGSEFPCVILPYDKVYSNLNRNLIYTSVTRAKKRVIMVGDPDSLYKGINNTSSSYRLTNVKNMVIGYTNKFRLEKGA